MVHQTNIDDLAAIERALQGISGGASAQQILLALATPLPLRTLQYRLKHLVERNRIVKEGGGRSARYRLAPVRPEIGAAASTSQPLLDEPFVPISATAAAIRDYVRRRPEARKPVGYDRAFLDAYRPNGSWYLSEAERRHLAQVGRPQIAQQPAGTYAKQILSRLIIDLAWNSRRLEGNTHARTYKKSRQTTHRFPRRGKKFGSYRVSCWSIWQ